MPSEACQVMKGFQFLPRLSHQPTEDWVSESVLEYLVRLCCLPGLLAVAATVCKA